MTERLATVERQRDALHEVSRVPGQVADAWMLPTEKSCRSEPSIMLSEPRQGRCRKSPVVSKATYPGAGDNVAR